MEHDLSTFNDQLPLFGGLGGFPFALYKHQGFKVPNHQSLPPSKGAGLLRAPADKTSLNMCIVLPHSDFQDGTSKERLLHNEFQQLHIGCSSSFRLHAVFVAQLHMLLDAGVEL